MFGDGTGVGINFSEYLIHTIKMKLIKSLVYMKKKVSAINITARI